MKEKLARFMLGRNGNDQLNLFLVGLSMAVLLLSTLLYRYLGRLLYPVALALLVWSYFRMFSRNVYKRQSENAKFLRLRCSAAAALKLRREKWEQRRDYKFYTCPSCKTTLRVPRGKGRIKVVCRKCGNSFMGKS